MVHLVCTATTWLHCKLQCVVLQVATCMRVSLQQDGSTARPFWMRGGDLVFCKQRSCNTRVELGAACQGSGCCTEVDQGGHPEAICALPAPGAPAICAVSGGSTSALWDWGREAILRHRFSAYPAELQPMPLIDLVPTPTCRRR